MIYFTSDTHFGHTNIIRYSNRPYANAREMDEALIANWNALVKQDDTVYHLGDFAFSTLEETKNILWRLNGRIHLVLGNHDKDIIRNWKFFENKSYFQSIQHALEIKVDGNLIVLSHYAHRIWNKSHRGSIHLYGHSHGSLPSFGKSVDVGVDSKEITSEYRPVSLDEVLEYMSKRTFESIDHHGA